MELHYGNMRYTKYIHFDHLSSQQAAKLLAFPISSLYFSQYSHSVVSNSLWTHGLQHTRPPCPTPTPRVSSNSIHRVSDANQPSHPQLAPSPPTFNLSHHQGLFQWVSSSHHMDKVLELQFQHQSLHWILRVDFLCDRLVWSAWTPRDSQESSPTPQFKSSNSSGLSFLYSPTLISIHDYWKNHSFD